MIRFLSPWRVAALVTGLGACVVCCSAPLLAGLGFFSLATGGLLGSVTETGVIGALVIGAIVFGAFAYLVRWRLSTNTGAQRQCETQCASDQSCCQSGLTTNVPACCSLSPSQLETRLDEFKDTLGPFFIDSERLTDTKIQWRFRNETGLEDKCHRLAALESDCCPGINMEIHMEGEDIIWLISVDIESGSNKDALNLFADLWAENGQKNNGEHT